MADRHLLLQISDPHLSLDGPLHGRVHSFEVLEELLDAAERSGEEVDALVLTGDLAERAEADVYRRLRAIVEPVAQRIGATVVYVPGNHDPRPLFREVLLDEAPSEDPIDQVIEVGDLRIVAVDSTVPGMGHGELSGEQLAWLGRTLSSPAPDGTILALHHPPIPSPVPFLDRIRLRDPQRLGEVLVGRDVLMVLAGHCHHTTSGILAGVPVWIATATAYQMDCLPPRDVTRGVARSAFTRVDVVDGHAYATHVPLAGGSPPLYEHGPAERAALFERMRAAAT